MASFKKFIISFVLTGILIGVCAGVYAVYARSEEIITGKDMSIKIFVKSHGTYIKAFGKTYKLIF